MNKYRFQVLALLFFILTFPALARVESINVNDIVSKLTKELNLTQDQAAAIKPIMQENMAKRQAFLETLEGEAIVDKKNVKITLQQLKQEKNQKLSQVLTQEQMKNWIQKQNLREHFNSDEVNYIRSSENGMAISPDGGSFKF